jgi:MFS family permease
MMSLLTRDLCFQGLPFSPFVSDLYGRRAALFIGGLIMLAGVAVQSASWNVGMLIGARVTSKSQRANVVQLSPGLTSSSHSWTGHGSLLKRRTVVVDRACLPSTCTFNLSWS